MGVGQTTFKNHDKEWERRQQQKNLGNCKAYEVVKDSTDKKTEYAISNAGIRLYHRTPPKCAVMTAQVPLKIEVKLRCLVQSLFDKQLNPKFLCTNNESPTFLAESRVWKWTRKGALCTQKEVSKPSVQNCRRPSLTGSQH